MKKYNKPEIVTLALETVDVIETSGAGATVAAIARDFTVDEINGGVQVIEKQITDMSTTWSW